MTTTPQLDPDRLDAFVGRFIDDLGTALHVSTVLVGDRLGLYAAMADGAAMTSAELATRTGTAERYVAEWLAGQAAAGYVSYADGAFRLPPEHAMLLLDSGAPVFIPGGFQVAASTLKDEPAITDAFRTGRGVGWHEHHPDLFTGCYRFTRPGYRTHLVADWLPALDGVTVALERGASVADVGCGYGASTIIMARAFPHSIFVGYDNHEPSIEAARRAARDAGLGEQMRFDTAAARDFPGTEYRLVTFFDCLHDMGDPVGAATHVRHTLAEDGTWLIVEPYAGNRIEDNLTPVGKVYYNASTMICTPASRAQDVGLALGAQAGEARIREVATQAGFTRFRRVAETPVNIVYEVRP